MDEDLTGTENLVLLGRLLGYGKSAGRAALDPRSRNQVWDIVRAVVTQGTTVLLTTQYLDEADQLASRIAVIDDGKVIAEGTKGELKSSVGAGSVHLRLRDTAQREEARRLLALCLDVPMHLEPDPVALSARVGSGDSAAGPAEQASRALAEPARAGITVDNFSLGQPSLDEVFLALTDGAVKAGLPARRRDRRCPRGRAAAHRLQLRLLLGVDDVRASAAHGEDGDGRLDDGDLPADISEQRVRRV